MSNFELERLNKKFINSTAEEIIKYVLSKYKDKIALASSLSIEDQVLTDMIYKIDKRSKIFSLDTGRLPNETYELINLTNIKYKNIIQIQFPDRVEVEDYVNSNGINAFYSSVENRKLCCKIRKVNVLKRALSNLDVWITGLRKEQSEQRQNYAIVELDEVYGNIKINPLANWSEKDVWKYIKNNDIPYNKLYDQGYKSIGCAPCSRTVGESEHPRNGRWWWENTETKECGLHIK